MFRQNGLAVFSANSNQPLTAAMQQVIYIGNGTGSYDYTLPEIGTDGVYGDKVPPGGSITIRNAGSGNCTLNILKHASDTGIYLGFSTAVTTFVLPVGASVKLCAATGGAYWYLIDGTNFFDEFDDLETTVGGRAASTNSAVLTNIGNGVEMWQFQPSTVGAGANKWLMGQRQITHGWDKQPILWHCHFSPASDLIASGTGIVVTWTVVWRTFHPGQAQAWTDEAGFTMTYALAAGTLSTTKNYNASVGGNDTALSITNPAASTMIGARLELTSVTNNGANQTTELIVNGWDAHMKLRRRGTVNPWPEP